VKQSPSKHPRGEAIQKQGEKSMERYAPSDGIYWTKYDAGRGKFSVPILVWHFGEHKLWHDEYIVGGPLECGDALKRRPTRPGWYICTSENGALVPVLLVDGGALGTVILSRALHDGNGVQFTEARPVKWMERKMNCKWFGPFIPPEEGCHV